MPQAALCLHCMHDNWVYTSQHCMHHEQQADMFNRLIGADVPLQLSEWGLRPETAVGCALDYLFRPREEVLDLVRDSYEALQDTSALKIGTQVWCMGQNCRMPSWLIPHSVSKSCTCASHRPSQTLVPPMLRVPRFRSRYFAPHA